MLHIRISLCIKFHSEQTILDFWTKFAQQRYFWPKTEKMNIFSEFIQMSLGTKFQLKGALLGLRQILATETL